MLTPRPDRRRLLATPVLMSPGFIIPPYPDTQDMNDPSRFEEIITTPSPSLDVRSVISHNSSHQDINNNSYKYLPHETQGNPEMGKQSQFVVRSTSHLNRFKPIQEHLQVQPYTRNNTYDHHTDIGLTTHRDNISHHLHPGQVIRHSKLNQVYIPNDSPRSARGHHHSVENPPSTNSTSIKAQVHRDTQQNRTNKRSLVQPSSIESPAGRQILKKDRLVGHREDTPKPKVDSHIHIETFDDESKQPTQKPGSSPGPLGTDRVTRRRVPTTYVGDFEEESETDVPNVIFQMPKAFEKAMSLLVELDVEALWNKASEDVGGRSDANLQSVQNLLTRHGELFDRIGSYYNDTTLEMNALNDIKDQALKERVARTDMYADAGEQLAEKLVGIQNATRQVPSKRRRVDRGVSLMSFNNE
ncbi:hypothetical protein M231_05939 [Tremella mesenterica]|uniref:Uncharacterized protein n=1 Tax=Tremella mesenterica TaxID=5217 RepID=A0A4Q1BGT6_TREME|nr:uncharacterized protein TREMEDRAFT_59678 [Tremella mesenterica DSM 1558]EIW73504.1 hypothetical protein TREMEDRAFT_59678 [Tremella mesenterica DSM 1558]RXK36778.1 hypothetical protein M231_05939 [Tremella mesenterica]